MNLYGNPLSTQKSYIRGVRDLMEGLQSLPEDLTVDQIKGHLASWRGKVSSSALNLRVCGIKFYFKNVVMRPDLAVDVPNPRVAKYVQDVLTELELELLFDACRSMREKALLYLLYDTGVRSREVCNYIVKEVLKRSKLKKEVHPHTFRHSFAVHFINNSGNLLRLKELMGHADIETTFHYLKFCNIPLFDISTPLAMMLKRVRERKSNGGNGTAKI